MDTTLALIFLSVSHTLSLPPGLLSALCFVESGHKPKAVNLYDGGSASLGACQIKHSTARVLGYDGDENTLRKPGVNIYYAGQYLRYQLTRYEGDVPKAVSAYNAGSHRVNSQGQIKNRIYVGKVMTAWAEGR